ncbi:MAG: hypothetical protein II956_04150 [Bacteroidales bacterium]|nr:hypothetical protein [Bacteroidales bacterium]MCR4561539.1 hypothetical protein [Bacteroidales bacterium]
MRKIIILLLLAMCMPFALLAQRTDISKGDIMYGLEAAGVGAQGTALVKLEYISKQRKIPVQVLQEYAVRGVLFKGIAAGEGSNTTQKPLCGSASAEQSHQAYFDKFFEDETYKSYVQFVEGSLKVVAYRNKNYKATANLVIMKDQLRKDLEAAGVIKGLGSGF